MAHDTDSVKRWLPVEEDEVLVHHVPLYDITAFEILGNLAAVAVLEHLLRLDAVDGAFNKIGSLKRQKIEKVFQKYNGFLTILPGACRCHSY